MELDYSGMALTMLVVVAVAAVEALAQVALAVAETVQILEAMFWLETALLTLAVAQAVESMALQAALVL